MLYNMKTLTNKLNINKYGILYRFFNIKISHKYDISWFILVFKYVIYNMCEIYKTPEYLFIV